MSSSPFFSFCVSRSHPPTSVPLHPLPPLFVPQGLSLPHFSIFSGPSPTHSPSPYPRPSHHLPFSPCPRKLGRTSGSRALCRGLRRQLPSHSTGRRERERPQVSQRARPKIRQPVIRVVNGAPTIHRCGQQALSLSSRSRPTHYCWAAICFAGFTDLYLIGFPPPPNTWTKLECASGAAVGARKSLL